MITDGIREFVSRDWKSVAQQTDAYWGARIAGLGPAEALRVAEELRRFVRQHNPAWPDPDSRLADVMEHVRVASLLRRADPTSRG